MKLINADRLMSSLADWKLQETPITTYPKPKEFTADDMQRMIWRTIRDCESAVEEQPTVKAVTVEWIEKYIKAKYNEARQYYAEFIFHARMMIYDWEKENGRSE